MAKTVRVTQVRSAIGCKKDQVATIKAMGLGKLHRTVELPDTPATHGMINKVQHLLRVEA